MQVVCAILLYFFTEDKYDYGFTKNIDIDENENEQSINISDSITAAVTPDNNYYD